MDFRCCLLTKDCCWSRILYSLDLAVIAKGAGAGAMDPTTAAALAAGKAFFVFPVSAFSSSLEEGFQPFCGRPELCA